MPAIPPGVGGAVITGWGTALPPKVAHQRRPRPHDGHQRRVDRRAHRHPRAPRRRHHRRPVGRVRAARRSRCPASTRPRSTRSSSPPPPPTGPCPATAPTVQHELGLRCGAFDVNAACSGFVYGLVVGPRAHRHGRRARSLRHRHRHALAHHRLERPQHRHPLRRRLRRGRARGGRRPRPAARLGPRRRRLGRALPVRRGRRLPPDGRQGGLPPGGAHHGRLGQKSHGPRRRHRRRHRARRAPPGQHPHHRGRLPAPRHPDGAHASTVLDRTGNTSSASIPLALADALDDGRVKRRRPRAARRLRRRHDRGQRRAALGRRRAREPGRPRHRRLPGHRPRLRPPLRRRSATRSPSPTTARPPPDGLFGVRCDVTSAESGRRRLHGRRGRSSARSRCWSPTPASPRTACCCG